jgi:hypothetical protein
VTSVDELTAADLKLWLTLEAPDSPPCDGLDDDGCGLEAVARAIWDGSCDHVWDESLLCVRHREELARALGFGGFLDCRVCRKLIRARIEPLR